MSFLSELYEQVFSTSGTSTTLGEVESFVSSVGESEPLTTSNTSTYWAPGSPIEANESYIEQQRWMQENMTTTYGIPIHVDSVHERVWNEAYTTPTTFFGDLRENSEFISPADFIQSPVTNWRKKIMEGR